MRPRENISYAQFKERILYALSKNKKRASEDKYDALLETKADYKIAVGKVAMSYKREMHSGYAPKMDDEWQQWLSDLKMQFEQGDEGKRNWNTLKLISSQRVRNLKSGGTRAEFAFAIHYRLHCLPGQPDHAAEIDREIWGETFEDKFHETVFDYISSTELQASFPNDLVFDENYQFGRLEFRKAKAALLLNQTSDSKQLVLVCGAGGYGKTSIAEEVCLDEEIREKFLGGIYWLQLELAHQSTGTIADNTSRLKAAIVDMFGRQYPQENIALLNSQNDQSVMNGFIDKLPKEEILLIVDDTWNLPTSRWIEELPAHVSVLATSRVQDTIQIPCQKVRVEGLAKSEAYSLISYSLENLSIENQLRLRKLATSFEGWPLVLRLANATAKARWENGADHNEILDELESFAQLDDVLGWDDETEPGTSVEKRRRLIGHCIKASLDTLPDDMYRSAALSLAVFPNNTDIPFNVVSSFWQELTGQNDSALKRIGSIKAKTIHSALNRLSFFNRYDCRTGTIRLHSIVQTYFGAFLGDLRLEEMHRYLIRSLKNDCLDGWHSLPKRNLYAWRHLLFHLEQANDVVKANNLRLDYHWCKEKLNATGPFDLQSDFNSSSLSADAKKMRQAVFLATPNLHDLPSSFAHQIFGRLSREDSLKLKNVVAEAKKDSCFWPRPKSGHLETIGSQVLHLVGHQNSVKSARFSHDGQRVVTASADRTIQIWDAKSGELMIAPLRGHTKGVDCAIFGSQTELVLSASADGTIRFWDCKSGKEIHERCETSGPQVCASYFDRFGEKVVSLSWDGSVIVRDTQIENYSQSLHFSPDTPPKSACFDKYGRRLLIVLEPDQVCVWDTRSKSSEKTRVYDFGTPIKKVAFHPMEKSALSVACDGHLIFWDVATGKPLPSRIPKHKCSINSVDFSPSGNHLLTSGGDGVVRLWDFRSGKLCLACRVSDFFAANSAVFDNTGTRFITSCDDGSAKIWVWSGKAGEVCDAPSGDHIVTDFNARHPYLKLESTSASLSEYSEVTTTFKDSETNEVLLGPLLGQTYADQLMHAAYKVFDRSGARILVLSQDGNVVILTANPGEISRSQVTLESSASEFVWASFSFKGDQVVTQSRDGTFSIWSSETGELKNRFTWQHLNTASCFLCGDSNNYLIVSDREFNATLFDISTSREVSEPLKGHCKSVLFADLSPNEQMVATVSQDHTLKIWDRRTGKGLSTVHFDNRPDRVSWNAELVVELVNGREIEFSY